MKLVNTSLATHLETHLSQANKSIIQPVIDTSYVGKFVRQHLSYGLSSCTVRASPHLYHIIPTTSRNKTLMSKSRRFNC